MKTIAEKMGIKPGMRSLLLNAPERMSQTMQLPELELAAKLIKEFDYIHFFAKNLNDLKKNFPRLKKHLKAEGALWISWPKAGQLDTDLSLPKIIETGYDNGLVESKTLSIDSVWSSIKFTFPKQGKAYNNTYGKLKTIKSK